jgi:8-oxo-dGTP diphosphatase
MRERTFPDRPWLGVGALIFQDDQVLLVKRGREPGAGLWSIPGGMVDVGETVKEALAREIREETGLLVEVENLVEVFERILPDDQGRVRYHYVVLDYLCRVSGGRLAASSDAADAGFYPVQGLRKLHLLPETEQVILKAYSLHQQRGGRPRRILSR